MQNRKVAGPSRPPLCHGLCLRRQYAWNLDGKFLVAKKLSSELVIGSLYCKWLDADPVNPLKICPGILGEN